MTDADKLKRCVNQFPSNDSAQHDDHIWLSIYDQAWAIHSIRWPAIVVWRGYWPALEFNIFDGSSVNWPAYCDQAVKLLYGVSEDEIIQ